MVVIVHLFVVLALASVADVSGIRARRKSQAVLHMHGTAPFDEKSCAGLVSSLVSSKPANVTEQALAECKSTFPEEKKCSFFANALTSEMGHSSFEASAFCLKVSEALFCADTMSQLLASTPISDLAFGECERAGSSKGEAYCRAFKDFLKRSVEDGKFDALHTCFAVGTTNVDASSSSPTPVDAANPKAASSSSQDQAAASSDKAKADDSDWFDIFDLDQWGKAHEARSSSASPTPSAPKGKIIVDPVAATEPESPSPVPSDKDTDVTVAKAADPASQTTGTGADTQPPAEASPSPPASSTEAPKEEATTQATDSSTTAAPEATTAAPTEGPTPTTVAGGITVAPVPADGKVLPVEASTTTAAPTAAPSSVPVESTAAPAASTPKPSAETTPAPKEEASTTAAADVKVVDGKVTAEPKPLPVDEKSPSVAKAAAPNAESQQQNEEAVKAGDKEQPLEERKGTIVARPIPDTSVKTGTPNSPEAHVPLKDLKPDQKEKVQEVIHSLNKTLSSSEEGADADKDGKVNYDEWVKAADGQGLTPQQAEQAFKVADVNGDGHVDQGEWKDTLEEVRKSKLEQLKQIAADAGAKAGAEAGRAAGAAHGAAAGEHAGRQAGAEAAKVAVENPEIDTKEEAEALGREEGKKKGSEAGKAAVVYPPGAEVHVEDGKTQTPAQLKAAHQIVTKPKALDHDHIKKGKHAHSAHSAVAKAKVKVAHAVTGKLAAASQKATKAPVKTKETSTKLTGAGPTGKWTAGGFLAKFVANKVL